MNTEVGGYQLHQQIAAPPRNPICASHPLSTLFLYFLRKAVRPCIYVGKISLDMVPEEHQMIRFGPFPF